ncbi:19720_t:CDS:2, partial [Gigaspora rosea]
MASDLKSKNDLQSIFLMDPKITFFEKFAERKRQREVIKTLLDRELLPLDAVKQNTFSLKYDALSKFDLENIWSELYNSERSLPPQTTQIIHPILTTFQIPAEFIDLLESEIFDHTKPTNKNSDLAWKQFALWAFFAISPSIVKQICNHCQCLWSKIKHAHQQHVKAGKVSLKQTTISKALCRNLKDKQIIASVLTDKMSEEDVNIKGYHHIFDPQCFKNALGETMVLFRVPESPKSKEFSKESVEHFGAFTGNNNEPYTTSNTASSHNRGLQPLSDAVNGYIKETYPALYTKMRKLDLGPNVPKSFGGFPTIAINFNALCQFHRNLKDHRNSLCVVCPLGTFEDGQLVFPELKLIIHAKQGQAIAFRSNILVHGNHPVLAGIRHSVVFFIHGTMIKQNRKFGSLFCDSDSDNEMGININSDKKK